VDVDASVLHRFLLLTAQ